MIKLCGENGSSFALYILGYQFPEPGENIYHANWLNVQVKYEDSEHSWKAVQPCLLTWEVQEIISWFRDLAKDMTMTTIMQFIEPNFKIQKLDEREGRFYLRFFFDFEIRPSDTDEIKTYFTDIALTRIELNQIAESLEADLKEYPRRWI